MRLASVVREDWQKLTVGQYPVRVSSNCKTLIKTFNKKNWQPANLNLKNTEIYIIQLNKKKQKQILRKNERFSKHDIGRTSTFPFEISIDS